jgi:hypothetical protein
MSECRSCGKANEAGVIRHFMLRGEQTRGGVAAFILEIDMRERLSVLIADNKRRANVLD